ncbi:MAG: recombinase family protein, partial [Halobacteriaceae archaeon]
DLTIIYRPRLKAIRWVGMSVTLIAFLSFVYVPSNAFIYPRSLGDYSFLNWELYTLLLPVLGSFGIGFERAKKSIDAVIRYPRVSSRQQENGTSLKKQNTTLSEEEQKLNPDNTIIVGDEWESACTMQRESINKIIRIVTNADVTYCIMVKSIDRLSRADPLEACNFLTILKENDCILYVDDLGYFDLKSLNQELIIIMKLLQSREEYKNIREKSESGIRSIKEGGGYPGRAPYGFKKSDDDDNKLYVCRREAELLRRGAELIIEGEEDGVEPGNVAGTKRQLDSEYETSDTEVPSESTLRNIYKKKLYTGKISHKGDIVGECPVIISQETFNQLQEILGTDDEESDSGTSNLDTMLKQVIDRYGVDTSLDLFDDILKGRCPECGDDVRVWGSTKRMGQRVKNYRCVNHIDYRASSEECGCEKCDCNNRNKCNSSDCECEECVCDECGCEECDCDTRDECISDDCDCIKCDCADPEDNACNCDQCDCDTRDDCYFLDCSCDKCNCNKCTCENCDCDYCNECGSGECSCDECNCEQEEEVCDFDGPLMSGAFLNKWEQSVPVICPVCQAPLSDDAWQKSITKIDAIEQRCSNCGTEISIDLPENKYERAMELPKSAIRFFEDKTKENNESSKENKEETDEEAQAEDNDSNNENHSLTNRAWDRD